MEEVELEVAQLEAELEIELEVEMEAEVLPPRDKFKLMLRYNR